MNRRWLVSRTNPEFIQYLTRAASVSPLLAQVLVNRGLKTPGTIKDFLNPGITGLSDPLELPDVAVALERIRYAAERNERILVHGDYDTDGLTATAILTQALRAIGLDVHFFIPNRMIHGYGFHPPAVELAEKLGAGLIITVDCGITSFDAVKHAGSRGIDVIITDHHEPMRREDITGTQEETFLIPKAVAVVNPKISPSPSPGTLLSGAGIAFKIVQALAADTSFSFNNDDALSLLDLAALGTIADVVPMTGENRALLSEGLRFLQNPHRPGMRALKDVSGIKGRELRAGLLSFTLVPRINAMGRMGDAHDVVNLFLSDSDETSVSLAETLDKTNTERQKIEERVHEEALSQLERKGRDDAIVLSDRGWHIGVIGIVASRIAEAFCRPTFVFTVEGDIAKGSARSIPAFDLHRGLTACSDMLISFGGHKQAAGIKLRVSDLNRFERRISDLVRESLHADDFIQTLEIDAEAPLSEITHALLNELSMLEPLGYGNPEPLLGAKGLAIVSPRIVGKNHLKMKLRQRSWSIDTVGFDMGELLGQLESYLSVDAAFTPTVNEWNGGRYIQLNLKGIRPGGLP